MPPGRPRSFTTERALSRAQDLFWRKGYRGTTTRDLQRAIGINQSSIYNAFGSKARLLDAVLERYADELAREVVGPLREDDRGLASLDAFFGRFVSWLADHGSRGCLIARMMGEREDLGPVVTARLRAYREQLREALRAGLARAAADGEIGAATVERRADLLLSVVLGVNLGAQGGAGQTEVRRMGDAVRAEIAGWRPGPPS
jgi:TetR/AcrR family transcriptional repressor of nem operon